jgi:hypothetical protein
MKRRCRAQSAMMWDGVARTMQTCRGGSRATREGLRLWRGRSVSGKRPRMPTVFTPHRDRDNSLSMREDPSTTFFTYDPSGRDAVNSGAPWSAQVDADLLWMIDEHRGVSTIAQFLCRTEREVRERARQLGHLLGRGTGKRRARS